MFTLSSSNNILNFQLKHAIHTILLISQCVLTYYMRRTYRYILTQETPVSYLDSIQTWYHTRLYATNLTCSINKTIHKINTYSKKIHYIQSWLSRMSGNFDIWYLQWSWSHELRNKEAIQICTKWRKGWRRVRHTTMHIYHFERVLTRNNKYLCNLNDNSNKAHRICKGRNTKVICIKLCWLQHCM